MKMTKQIRHSPFKRKSSYLLLYIHPGCNYLSLLTASLLLLGNNDDDDNDDDRDNEDNENKDDNLNDHGNCCNLSGLF